MKKQIYAITTIVDKDVMDQIDELRADEGVSRSKWAQQAIVRYVAILNGYPAERD